LGGACCGCRSTSACLKQWSRAWRWKVALVGKFTGHLNAESRLEENDGASQKTVDAPWTSFRFSIAMSPEQEAGVRSGLAELVDMRNRLMHHFIEHFDISDVKDCRSASVYRFMANI
jgi:hypothetical protein